MDNLAILLLAALVVASLLVTLHWVLPLHQLREGLKTVAKGGTPRLLAVRGPTWFRLAARDLEAVAETLRERHRQAEDEGFNFRAILGSMIEGVLITDERLRIRLINSALVRMFEVNVETLNRTLMEVFQNHDLHRAVSQTLEDGEPKIILFTLGPRELPGHMPRYFEANISPLTRAGETKPAGAIAVFHNITEIKTLERIRQELVANVSHELRTPLAIIHGYVETLLDGAIDNRETAEKFLRIMHRHGERLNLLIEDLLTISKLESGSGELQTEPIQLRRCIETIKERLDARITDLHAKVTLSIPPDLPTVDADPHRIDQVVFNLMENALKFTAPTPVEIEISAEPTPQEIIVRIRDNGPGIPLEDQPHIFERFYRVEKDRNRSAGGTGLGLSIVRQVILAHGGHVGVESVPGNGATFWFTLPRQRPAPAPASV